MTYSESTAHLLQTVEAMLHVKAIAPKDELVNRLLGEIARLAEDNRQLRAQRRDRDAQAYDYEALVEIVTDLAHGWTHGEEIHGWPADLVARYRKDARRILAPR